MPVTEVVHHPLVSETAQDRELYHKQYTMNGLQELQTIVYNDPSVSNSGAYFTIRPPVGNTLVDRNLLLENQQIFVVNNENKTVNNLSHINNFYERILSIRDKLDYEIDPVVAILGQEVDDYIINLIIAQMLFLDKEDGHLPIEFYINSPGGSVSAGLALYDVMHTISAPVNTTCVGLAASMGAVLLAGGTGTRASLPHSRIMIHQVSSGARGTSADLRIQMAETNKLENVLFQILADKTGKTSKQIAKDCDRDYYMSAEEAKTSALNDLDILQKKSQTALISTIVKVALYVIVGVGIITSLMYTFALVINKDTQTIGSTWSNMLSILLTNAFSIVGTLMGVKYASENKKDDRNM